MAAKLICIAVFISMSEAQFQRRRRSLLVPNIERRFNPSRDRGQALHAHSDRDLVQNEFLLGARTMVSTHMLLSIGSTISRLFALYLKKHMSGGFVKKWNVAWMKLWVASLGSSSIYHYLETKLKSGFQKVALLASLLTPLPVDFLMSSLFGPMAEEIAYRGVAQWLMHAMLKSCRIKKSHAALLSRVGGAYFFGLAHTSPVQSEVEVFLRAQKGIGTFLSSLLVESRLSHHRHSIWGAVGAHAMYNLVARLPHIGALHTSSILGFSHMFAQSVWRPFTTFRWVLSQIVGLTSHRFVLRMLAKMMQTGCCVRDATLMMTASLLSSHAIIRLIPSSMKNIQFPHFRIGQKVYVRNASIAEAIQLTQENDDHFIPEMAKYLGSDIEGTISALVGTRAQIDFADGADRWVWPIALLESADSHKQGQGASKCFRVGQKVLVRDVSIKDAVKLAKEVGNQFVLEMAKYLGSGIVGTISASFDKQVRVDFDDGKRQFTWPIALLESIKE